MAFGIFELAALGQIDLLPSSSLTTFALGLLVIWGFIAASFFSSWREGRLASGLSIAIDPFAVGTWVAGTAITAQVLMLGVPEWRSAAIVIAVVASALWFGYLPLAYRGVRAIVTGLHGQRVTGSILLTTVSTQSMALLVWHLWPDAQPVRSSATALILLGLLFYAVGIALILRRYLDGQPWTLAEDWDNTNCIMHGAISISGLAIAQTGLLPEAIGIAAWLAALGTLVVVEAIEIARMIQRIGRFGLRRGVLTYHVTQWSRNFTFGMFYAFTLAISPSGQPPAALAGLRSFIAWFVAWGPWIVLFLLLTETILWSGASVSWSPRSGQRQDFID